MNAAAAEAAPAAKKIDDQVADLVPKILALNDPFQEVRSHIGSLTYEIEVSKSESRKDSLRKQIEELKQETHKIKLPGWTDAREMKFDDMNTMLLEMKAQKAELLQQRVEIMKKTTALSKERDAYLSDRIPGASTDTLTSVQNSLDKFDISHSPDPYKRCGPGGPLRVLPPGHARAGAVDRGEHGRRRGIRQPSQ